MGTRDEPGSRLSAGRVQCRRRWSEPAGKHVKNVSRFGPGLMTTPVPSSATPTSVSPARRNATIAAARASCGPVLSGRPASNNRTCAGNVGGSNSAANRDSRSRCRVSATTRSSRTTSSSPSSTAAVCDYERLPRPLCRPPASSAELACATAALKQIAHSAPTDRTTPTNMHGTGQSPRPASIVHTEHAAGGTNCPRGPALRTEASNSRRVVALVESRLVPKSR